jgi:signal transduction histidine kinase
MFANIGRRTQNLAGRQTSLIDDLARQETDPRLLDRLYRLDNVATRLRRSADSLLVVSGTVDQLAAGGPADLVDVVNAALADIEGHQAVELLDICDVTITAGLVADLRLLLAELLENATTFSPPSTPVRVRATLAERCRVAIVDNGLGMSTIRLAEENQRLVERERLDVAPTTMLGMFVVGRLARRHGLTVRLSPSPERGVTATVDIPVGLFAPSQVDRPKAGNSGLRRPRRAPTAIPAGPSGAFTWFEPAAPTGPQGVASAFTRDGRTGADGEGRPRDPTPAQSLRI